MGGAAVGRQRAGFDQSNQGKPQQPGAGKDVSGSLPQLKGDKERGFSELLSDLDLHHPPCQDLQANRMFYALATLAYNALMALKLLHLPESEQPKRVRTLIRHLLLVPVEITRHARQWKACLYLPAGWMACGAGWRSGCAHCHTGSDCRWRIMPLGQ